MPELPEVETVRRGLQSLVAGQVIEWVDVRLPRIIRSPSVDEFVHELQNARIVEVRRRGKYLLLDLGERTLVSHLRMEGHYGVFLASEPLLPHTHVIFHLLGGQELRYQDVRQFGTMDLLLSDHIPHFAPLHLLGPEPLQENFTPTYLRDVFKNVQLPLKLLYWIRRLLLVLAIFMSTKSCFGPRYIRHKVRSRYRCKLCGGSWPPRKR